MKQYINLNTGTIKTKSQWLAELDTKDSYSAISAISRFNAMVMLGELVEYDQNIEYKPKKALTLR